MDNDTVIAVINSVREFLDALETGLVVYEFPTMDMIADVTIEAV